LCPAFPCTSQPRAPFPLGLKLGPIPNEPGLYYRKHFYERPLRGIFVSPRNTPRPYLNPGGNSCLFSVNTKRSPLTATVFSPPYDWAFSMLAPINANQCSGSQGQTQFTPEHLIHTRYHSSCPLPPILALPFY
jgi:hypothetical protein